MNNAVLKIKCIYICKVYNVNNHVYTYLCVFLYANVCVSNTIAYGLLAYLNF